MDGEEHAHALSAVDVYVKKLVLQGGISAITSTIISTSVLLVLLLSVLRCCGAPSRS